MTSRSQEQEVRSQNLCACGHAADTHDGGGYCGVQFGAEGFCGCDKFTAVENALPYGLKELETEPAE
jgi:hypothetical protein